MIATLIFWGLFILIGFLLRKKFIWEKDKTLHWIVGFLIPVIVMLAGWNTGFLNFRETLFYGFGLAILAATIKELVIDKWLKMGNCTLMDWIFTFTGGFAGTFLFVLPIINSQ